MVIDAGAATQSRQIAALRHQGAPITVIVTALAAGPPRTDGRAWTYDRVHRLLYNLHLYRGGRHGNDLARWPAILEPDPDAGT